MSRAHSPKGQIEVGKLEIGRRNVGRIAERIVANELEARGFRVSDLNKDGNAPNVDLLAFWPGRGQPLQVQVKSAANGPKEWRLTYGSCTQEIIEGTADMFNRHKGAFYKADFVVLVVVRSPKEYRCFVLPIDKAEKAAQFHLDFSYRAKRWKPGTLRLPLERGPRAKERENDEREIKLILPYEDDKGWAHLLRRARTAAK